MTLTDAYDPATDPDAPAASRAHVGRNLLDRVGGPQAVAAAVEVFYARIVLDPLLAGFFAGLDMDSQRTHLRAFLTTALGGPALYRGRELGEVHRHLRLTDAHFDAVAGHLLDTLAELGVDRDCINDIAAAVGPLRTVIVTA